MPPRRKAAFQSALPASTISNASPSHTAGSLLSQPPNLSIRSVSRKSRGRRGHQVTSLTAPSPHPSSTESTPSLPPTPIDSSPHVLSTTATSIEQPVSDGGPFADESGLWDGQFLDAAAPAVDASVVSDSRAQKSVIEGFRDSWREIVLLWDLRSEGLGDLQLDPKTELPACEACGSPGACFRCDECIQKHVVCKQCIVSAHEHVPLHRIKHWNGAYWAEDALAKHGLVLHLGHRGRLCPFNRGTESDKITVIDISGVHEVTCCFCKCPRPIETGLAAAQLMEVGWWPATFGHPQTVATVRTLKLYQAYSAQSKMNIYDFWQTLSQISDNTGTRTIPHRYRELSRIIPMFEHIRATKRAGRGHDNSGIKGTKLGELALRCIACAIPGVNLPPEWENEPGKTKFKYARFLSTDANFKMKHKKAKDTDIPLANGLAYFGNAEDYAEHLATHTDTKEMKSCSSTHQAIAGANSPGEARFDVNGVGAVICGRHLTYLPSGVNDLSKGERYVSMDYSLFKAIELSAQGIKAFVITYDIACQWSKNVHTRLANYHTSIKLSGEDIETRFFIPKFHLRAHGQSCQENFSLNFAPGVGRTCGEGIEAGWAACNSAALATREMGVSARREALDHLFSAINWRKTLALGSWLGKGLAQAVKEHGKQKALFDDFETTFPPETVRRWRLMYDSWVENPDNPNPFHEGVSGNVIASARLELLREESDKLAGGATFLHDIAPSAFISSGIDLEDEQYDIRTLAKSDASSLSKSADLIKKRNTFFTNFKKWHAVQAVYMARLIAAQVEMDFAVSTSSSAPKITPIDITKPESVTLWLPSQLTSSVRASLCAPGLPDVELKLRLATLDSTLHHIRRQILTHTAAVQYTKIHIHGPGQKQNTRARTTIAGLSAKLKRGVERYRRAWFAARALDPDGGWKNTYRQLTDADLKPPTKDENTLGVGFRELGWIWRIQRADHRDVPFRTGEEQITDDDIQECLRVEWAEGYARVQSWSDETTLLCEEMRRAVVTLLHDAEVWRGRADSRTILPSVPGALLTSSVPVAIASGLKAFAARQAATREDLAIHFYLYWLPTLHSCNIQIEWPSQIVELSNAKQSKSKIDLSVVDSISVARTDISLDLDSLEQIDKEDQGLDID